LLSFSDRVSCFGPSQPRPQSFSLCLPNSWGYRYEPPHLYFLGRRSKTRCPSWPGREHHCWATAFCAPSWGLFF
jgi:hypothetical protein